MSQMLSPTTTAVSMGPPNRGEEQVRIRFRVLYLIAGDDGRAGQIDAEGDEICGRGFHAGASRNSPSHAIIRQTLKQFTRTW